MKTIFGFCFLLLATAARGQSPAKPLVLAASPELDGEYRKTVLIAVPVGDGHIGFILNRPTDVTLATAGAVHFGGPQLEETLFAVVRGMPRGDALPLFDDVFLVANALDRVADRAPDEARFFSGFVVWRPGALDKEIEGGRWLITDADPALVFRQTDGSLWEELIQRISD